MSYNAKNYTEQGGEVTHIGGKLIIEEGAEVEGLPAPEVEAATENTFGGVKAAGKNGGYTVQCKIGADGKLYVPTYPEPVSADRLVCTFTINEGTSTWECDQTVEDIRSAFNAHKAVEAYIVDGQDAVYVANLCYVTSAKLEFHSAFNSVKAAWESNAWTVSIPE